ncbi:unnamed protein product [Hermetia illucens]|uniref:Uncharacterized protein n=1 Tax=Hermetia illucens TaxID=343691 RepID=A0A7R8USI3_HERIL|nr:uncharacterized protein LOC119652392 [Hermetia illucens]XP_037912427.1 uncharacterized protein LOC119652392 [Hermetia illucens]XP_037912570.1 uncharacterized protein LOC119652472 [Hermetia illucens]CAD7086229.1 unnamed protein product [Hermetia illucens]
MSQPMPPPDIDGLNSHDEYNLNIIGLRYNESAPKSNPYIEYDFYPFDNVSPAETQFYKFCVDLENARKLIREELVVSHWHMHSQKEGHFLLGYTLYDRILIVLGRRLVYWYLESNLPFPTLKYGIIRRSYWFCNITIELVEFFLSKIVEGIEDFSWLYGYG